MRTSWIGLALCTGLLVVAFVIFLLIRPGISAEEAAQRQCEEELRPDDREELRYPFRLYFTEEVNACMIERGQRPNGLYNR